MAEQKKDLTTSFNIGQILADALSSPNSPGGYIVNKWGGAGGNIGQGIANVLMSAPSGGPSINPETFSKFSSDDPETSLTALLGYGTSKKAMKQKAMSEATKAALTAAVDASTQNQMNMLTKAMEKLQRPTGGSGVPSDLYASATAKDITLTPQANAELYGLMSGMGSTYLDPRMGTGQNILQAALKGLGGYASGARSNTDLLNEQAKLNAQMQQQTFNNKLAAGQLMSQEQNARNAQEMQMYLADKAALMNYNPQPTSISQAVMGSNNPYAIDALAKQLAAQMNDNDMRKQLEGLSSNPALQTAVQQQDLQKRMMNAPMNETERNAVLQALKMNNLINTMRSGINF